ncbi:four helix bundle protein [Candidatus Berkelbacteria bacterium]|nr:four helix bundle protein [Candidatus Berkelbacteria bacterium]
MKSYRDLVVWQKGMELVERVYAVTDSFPRAEQFGLINQMRRAAVSIVSNIAEGSCRGSRKDFRQFAIMALGSGAELETQLELSKRLSFGKDQHYTEISQLLDEVMRMLNSLIRKLATSH